MPKVNKFQILSAVFSGLFLALALNNIEKYWLAFLMILPLGILAQFVFAE